MHKHRSRRVITGILTAWSALFAGFDADQHRWIGLAVWMVLVAVFGTYTVTGYRLRRREIR